jgi:hypothetical protein
VGKLLKNGLNIVILSGNWGLEWPARVESGWNEYCIGNWKPFHCPMIRYGNGYTMVITHVATMPGMPHLRCAVAEGDPAPLCRSTFTQNVGLSFSLSWWTFA